MTRAKPVALTGATFSVSIARIAIATVARFLKVLKNRRQIARLVDLDDRTLKDIGLIRSDVDAALAMPLNKDPSNHLIDVSGHRCLGKAVKPSHINNSSVDMNRLRRPDPVVTSLHLYPKS
jgi:uncharacterized protein YjiS (DUF1127 family)